MQIAVFKHPEDRDGLWCISPLDYFIDNGELPSENIDVVIDGMEFVDDRYGSNTIKAINGGSGLVELMMANVEIIKDPIWYFDDRFIDKLKRDISDYKSNGILLKPILKSILDTLTDDKGNFYDESMIYDKLQIIKTIIQQELNSDR